MSSKRDYVAVAAIIKEQIISAPTIDHVPTVEAIARGLADHFEQHNPAFDRERFLKAAGCWA